MKTKFEIIDSDLNRAEYPDLIGQIVDDPPGYANVRLIKEKTPMEEIFKYQSNWIGEKYGKTTLEDFAVKSLKEGYSKEEIVAGITKFYRQCEEVATNIFNRAVVIAAGIKPPKSPKASSKNWYKKAQIGDLPSFKDLNVRRMYGLMTDYTQLARSAADEMNAWLENQEYDISFEEAKERLSYQLGRMGLNK